LWRATFGSMQNGPEELWTTLWTKNTLEFERLCVAASRFWAVECTLQTGAGREAGRGRAYTRARGRAAPSSGRYTDAGEWLRVLLCEILVAGPLHSSLSQRKGPRPGRGPYPFLRAGLFSVFGPVQSAYQDLCTKGQPKAGPDAPPKPGNRTRRVPRFPPLGRDCVKTLSYKTSVNYPRTHERGIVCSSARDSAGAVIRSKSRAVSRVKDRVICV
jgi:hypothetical protein